MIFILKSIENANTKWNKIVFSFKDFNVVWDASQNPVMTVHYRKRYDSYMP